MTYRSFDAAEWIARQPKSVRDAGETRGDELIRDYTLREVREAVRRTQVEVAAALGTSQDRISKLEHGEDALVSTLRRHVRALGGELRLIVEFPDRPPMTIELRGGKARAGRAGGVRAVR
jgi:DNA-binding XRE family transcriptional regulator